jgi:hypothetical protein
MITMIAGLQAILKGEKLTIQKNNPFGRRKLAAWDM